MALIQNSLDVYSRGPMANYDGMEELPRLCWIKHTRYCFWWSGWQSKGNKLTRMPGHTYIFIKLITLIYVMMLLFLCVCIAHPRGMPRGYTRAALSLTHYHYMGQCSHIDTKHLNTASKRSHHRTITLEKSNHKLRGTKSCSKLDTRSGYCSVTLQTAVNYITNIITFGRFCFGRPFGIPVRKKYFKQKWMKFWMDANH